MPHLLIAGKLHPAGLAWLETARDLSYDYVEEISESSYAPLIGRADALVIRTQPLPARVIAEAGRLQLVSLHGVDYDSVDVAALNARRIPLCIVGGTNSPSVAEHAMMLILACAKQAIRADRAARSGGWEWRNRLEAAEVAGKRLLILGLGPAGRRLAGMAQGFDMEVRGFDPFLAERGWPEGPAAPVASLHEGLAWADIVSVHVPKAVRPLIGAAEFARLKPGAIVVNTARRRRRGRVGRGAGRGPRRSRRARRVRRRAAGAGSSAARLRFRAAFAAYRGRDD